ncbi:hypothetical protein AMS68_004863 [Peltaster fructicola]|uniref:mRNA decay factor PAT1 domain-containing protein n=1 Tax=Peltaster fructicola TaxID=286661 RepID=A0A6H0XXD5_9PEZI|nr:hypothetical protein AMS68_004863 [Peltaster fructicola]
MSFFGFDTALPRDKEQQQGSRGLFERHDPFAGLGGQPGAGGDDDVLDFEETYDGLGQQLDESGDTFNDDTFGGEEPVTQRAVGKDFDFAGNTAAARGALLTDQTRYGVYQAQQYQAPAPQSRRTGYEAYKEPEYIPRLEADASIWGTSIAKKPEPQASSRKMMSLEEVEAMMRNQARPTQPPAAAPAVSEIERQSQGLRDMLGVGQAPPVQAPPQPQILQRPQRQEQQMQVLPDFTQRAPQILQRQQPSHEHFLQQQQQQQPQGQGQGQGAPFVQGGPQSQHARGPSYSGPPITQAQQMMQMRPEEREAYLAEEARRAKRNHKIFLLSKNNGLMTPQDKNFITRIQLQQLLTATGGVDNAPGSEEQLAEDFYYQVYAQIRRPPQQAGPGQPLSQFAQTYLFQTSSRYGYGRGRHHPRGGDNHIQRMEQQVARAVEAAKARPKNKSLVVEGSLGKIAFSNSKTPRPLLNIKQRPESEARVRAARSVTIANRKSILRDIEEVYRVLMRLEDHERRLPPPPNEDSPPEIIEAHMHWRSEMADLNQRLWSALKVMEPIQSNPTTIHPFIQILSHSKGKKVLPRVYRHLDENQRLTTLTLLVIHLDVLDVVREAYPPADNMPLPARVKEEIELFSQVVIPPLFSFVNEAPLGIIIGLLGLIMERVNVHAVVRTKIGLTLLTMLISRAELLKQSLSSAPTQSSAEDIASWNDYYGRLFDTLEPVLPHIFPTDTTVAAADDVYVWQFLAAMGVGASPEQQQRLVIGVKDRVMETVGVSRALPEDMRARRLGDVNLFMRAIGLDVELLG